MTNLHFNVSKLEAGHYAKLPETNDALILIPLESSGLVADSVMEDYDTVAAVLAGASNEQTTIGRKTISSVTVTTDDTANEKTVTFGTQTYLAPTGNAVGAFVVAYDPDTTAGTDADLVPLTKHDVTWTPDGNNTDVSFSTVMVSG